MLRARHHCKNFIYAFNPHSSFITCEDSSYSHFADEETEVQVKQFQKSQS